VQPLVAGKSIVRRGDKPTRCFLIKDGFVSSAKSTNQGNDGITGIHIAGDMPDLFGLHLEIMDTDMRAATECTVAFVDHTAIRELCDDYPRLNRALWRLTLVDAAILREWIINVGHRPALVRLAHVFCEVMLRQNEVGRAFNNVCALPFTQLTLAEVTGMSTVHLNRSLQELRARKLIKFDGETLQILDFEALMEEADFEVDYLHLHHVPNFN
jgi:CRP-like cAMP-binding protein